MRTLRWFLPLVFMVFLSCELVSDLDDVDFAKGGVKGKPASVIVDSITVIPVDTTVVVGDVIQYRVLYWINGETIPRLRCSIDDLVYPYLGSFDVCPGPKT